jgi:GST-like protein
VTSAPASNSPRLPRHHAQPPHPRHRRPGRPGRKPLSLFESGAILVYLAEKAGRLIPADPAARYACLQWLMFQMGGVGPMFGQYGHFHTYAPERIPYAMERYANEVQRLHRVLEKRLSRPNSWPAPSIPSPTSPPSPGSASRAARIDLSHSPP